MFVATLLVEPEDVPLALSFLLTLTIGELQFVLETAHGQGLSVDECFFLKRLAVMTNANQWLLGDFQ